MFVFDEKGTKISNIQWSHTAWDLTANVNPMSLLVSEENKMCNSSVTQLSIQLKLCRRKNLTKQKYDLILESSIVFSRQVEKMFQSFYTCSVQGRFCQILSDNL